MAIPFRNALGRIRWQPVLPDGRREYEACWMDPDEPQKRSLHVVEDHILNAPVLYRSERSADRAAAAQDHREYTAQLNKFKEVGK